MLEADALVDWQRLRAGLGHDLRGTRERPRPSPALRLGAWLLFALGWLWVGFPLLAVPAIVLFERYVAPGLARLPVDQLELGPWLPPPSFVVSPESLPPRRSPSR